MAMNMKHSLNNMHHRGFVILFTILISTVILLMGFGIYSIATRETVLSGSAREAQYAFYAADAGVECALFAQTLGSAGGGPLSGGGGSFACGATTNSLSSVQVTGGGTSFNPYVFDVLVDAGQKTCTHVSVFDTGVTRRVIAQGYNVCTDIGIPVVGNPRLVERVLDTTYALAAPEPSEPVAQEAPQQETGGL
jgi:hypothetical protein